MSDITALIQADHEWLRQRFAVLDDARTPADLGAIWRPLAARLEIHAKAEEQVFYPRLLKRADEDGEQTRDALSDHNKIRAAIREADEKEVGTSAWHEAVHRTRKENSDHLSEEELGPLPDFRKNAGFELRAELGAQWLRFYAEHSPQAGVSSEQVDVQAYMQAKKPEHDKS